MAATAIGEKTWSSPEEAGDLLMLAEDIAWAVDGISFRETYPDGWIPVNYLVETLSRYFDGIDRRAWSTPSTTSTMPVTACTTPLNGL